MKGNIYKTKRGWLVWFPMGHEKDLRKHFVHKIEAERFLNGLRFEYDRGILDSRDYRADNPLGFENLVEAFLHHKRLLKGVDKYEQRLRFGILEWGSRNVKTIGFAEISGLITTLRERGYSNKYCKDIRDCIKSLYLWLVETGEIAHDQMPKFPTIKASSPFRNILDKDTQLRILLEVDRITIQFNRRIYIGILFLATYINLRPKELLSIKEKDIDLQNKRILIRESKTGEPKYVYLLEEDIALLETMPPAFGELFFFRHVHPRRGVATGAKFGHDYLYVYWKKACRNLGITGVDLYGGTRHSSAVALRESRTPEEIRRATGHRTGAAFDRYLQIKGDELRQIYAQARCKTVIKLSDYKENAK